MKNRELIKEMKLVNVHDEFCTKVEMEENNIKIIQNNRLGTTTMVLDIGEQRSLYKCLQLLLDK